MRRTLCAVLLASASVASAHRLDEYLQLTALSTERGQFHATLYLTPGIAVAQRVIGFIDANGDGVLSGAEQRTYALRVARDLELAVDGARRSFRVVAARFPTVASMRQGLGTIEIDLDAAAPAGLGKHTLAFENRHQRSIAAYLVECLAPTDPSFEITAQSRSREQARYGLRYVRTKTG